MATEPVLADSHIHLFENGFIGPDGRSPSGGDEVAEYEKLRQVHNIDTALVVGYEGEKAYHGNNAYIGRTARRHSWIKPLAYLHHSASHRDVVEWLDEGFYGVSIYAVEEGDAESLADLIARVGPVLSERRALISLNVSAAVYSALRVALEGLAGAPALISHFGLPTKGAGTTREAHQSVRSLVAMHENPSVFVKASGFYALGDVLGADEVLTTVMEDFGPERVLWGSDYPVVLSSESFRQSISHLSTLPQNARPGIMGETLRDVLARVEFP
ncbi:amidohydrolase family protein [Pseudactinotalea sp. Z1748]|uniref:amidohydrolase family protein n=1 Tax=Pseudactinotalea sp. Z1748 TaxID=3413027 RepID=UPI003C7B6EAF